MNPCIDGARAVSPTPPGLTCQQKGNLGDSGPRDGNDPHPENSVNGCGAYCLNQWDCEISQYTPADGLCTYYFKPAADSGFVADPSSGFEFSDMGCFELC